MRSTCPRLRLCPGSCRALIAPPDPFLLLTLSDNRKAVEAMNKAEDVNSSQMYDVFLSHKVEPRWAARHRVQAEQGFRVQALGSRLNKGTSQWEFKRQTAAAGVPTGPLSRLLPSLPCSGATPRTMQGRSSTSWCSAASQRSWTLSTGEQHHFIAHLLHSPHSRGPTRWGGLPPKTRSLHHLEASQFTHSGHVLTLFRACRTARPGRSWSSSTGSAGSSQTAGTWWSS